MTTHNLNQRFKTWTIIVVIVAFVTAGVNAQDISENQIGLNVLRGDNAVQHLRETENYNSLVKAVKVARQKNWQFDEEKIQDSFEQTAKITAADGASNDLLGTSVVIAGDTVVVGAFGDDNNKGAAYVFVRNGAVWAQQQKLTAADGEAGDFFGRSISLSGNTIIVGAYLDDVSGNADQGSAYVFTRNGNAWTQEAKLVAADGGSVDWFGWNVTISGDTVVAGSIIDDVNGISDQGSAYVFIRTGTTWAQQIKLTSSDGASRDFFGSSVSLTSDNLIIGAAGDNIGNNADQGSVYVFIRNGSAWEQQAKFIATDGAAGDFFGTEVASSGNSVVIGVGMDDVGSNINQGSVYVFVRNGSVWTEQQKLVATDGATEDHFGEVSISGDTIIIGAVDDDIGGNINQGSAYVFTRSGSVWTQQQKLTASDGAANDQFGWRVAVSGNTVIVGSVRTDIGGNADQGSAYIFLNALNNRRAPFDFDGDGRSDISVYRPSDTVWYLLRSNSGFTAAQFGIFSDKITPADYDGDGKTDIAVYRDGVWYWLNSSNGTFNAYQFGIASDIPVPADFTGDGRAELAVYRSGIWFTFNLVNNQFQAIQFGIPTDKPVAADYDGDGRADMAVVRQAGGESIWYVLGSTQGFYGIQFGFETDKLVPADYDGDGKTDIAVYRNGTGFWYVLGSTQGFYGLPFGIASDIPAAADYDGDGKADIAVYRNDNGVWYILGSTQGFYGVQFGLANDRPIPAAFIP